MSTLSQFTGGGSTKAIVNAYSSGGVTPPNFNIDASAAVGTREVLSGALTANTLKTLLTVNQAGQMPYLSFYAKDATSRTMRCVVIADGVTVYDSTTAAVAQANRGYPLAFALTWNGAVAPTMGYPIRWAQSLVVQVASSLSETDKVAIAYALN